MLSAQALWRWSKRLSPLMTKRRVDPGKGVDRDPQLDLETPRARRRQALRGQVPALQLDSGELVTEGPVIVQMIADKAAGKNLAPANGSTERYKLQEWLNFITTELHKNFSPLFQPTIPDEVKTFFKDRIKGKFKYADSKLAGQDYLMGKQFTVADGYLFVMLKWAERTGMDLSEFKNLMAYKDRVAARPNVQAALKMEGQLKAA